jgi:tetratricopeptide (TPR) repeat protein
MLLDLLVGTIASEAVGRAVSGGRRLLLGPEYEPALRRVTADAIDNAIEEVAPALTSEQAAHLRSVLAEGQISDRGLAITNTAQLRTVLREWTVGLDRPEFGTEGYMTSLGIDPQRLADAICHSIQAGIEADARAGGTLRVAAEWLRRDREAAALASHTDILEAIRGQVTALVSSQRATDPMEGRQPSGGLPGEVRTLVGRDEVVAELNRRVLRHDPSGSVGAIHVIHGMAGVGKTAMAVHVARENAHRYPDHLLFLDLQGSTPGVEPMHPTSALEQLLRDAGEEAGTLPLDLAARAARWRSTMARRKALLVLDNARDSEQVLPLLPAAAGCLVLVTSRRRLTAIPEAVPLELGLMPDDEATALFRDAVGDRDIGADLLMKLVAACGGVALAVVILAGRLRNDLTVDASRLVADLADARELLTELSPEDLGVRAALRVSVHRLPPDRVRVYDVLGQHPGPWLGAAAVAALADTSPRHARAVLRDLADHHLIEPEPAGGPAPRYRIHDLLRLFARERAENSFTPDELIAATERLARFYRTCLAAVDWLTGLADEAADAHVAAAAGYGVVLADADAARLWFAAERDNVVAFAPTAPGADGARMCMIAGGHLRRSGRYAAGREVYLRAREEYVRLVDRRGEADAIRTLADIDRLTGEYGRARDGYQRAHDMFAAAGPPRGVADSLRGLADVARLLGDYAAAAASYEQARDAYEAIGYELGVANAVHGLGTVGRLIGEYDVARERYAQARTTYQRLGNRLGEAHSCLGLADTAFARGDYPEADRQYRTALDLYAALDDPRGLADALRGIAHLDRLAGDLPAARDGFQQASDIYTRLGDDLGRATAAWGLGFVARASNETHEAAAYWRHALELYERVGAPDVLSVRAALESLTSATGG